MTGGEVPKRLAPQTDVTRRLYLLSGNRCSFPGCTQPIIGPDGVLVGEICHIRAALPDGPRFAAAMTNEERRAFDNLILMCANHHKVIDDKDSDTWTIAKLDKLKAEHEMAYSGVINQLRAQVSDITEGTEWTPPANLNRILSDGHASEEETAQNIAEVGNFAKRLAKVPFTSRSLLALIVIRGSKVGWAGSSDQEIKVPAALLEAVAGCTRTELHQHTEILRHAGFLSFDRDPMDEYETPTYFIGNSSPGVGWPLFCEIKDVAAGDDAIARQVLENLDFTALDT